MRDLIKIIQTQSNFVNQLIADGKRHPTSPTLNNFASWKYEPCGMQWGQLRELLESQQYDAKWDFIDRMTFLTVEFRLFYLGPHQWGIAVSSDPDDPMLILDPWKNSIEMSYEYDNFEQWFAEQIEITVYKMLVGP